MLPSSALYMAEFLHSTFENILQRVMDQRTLLSSNDSLQRAALKRQKNSEEKIERKNIDIKLANPKYKLLHFSTTIFFTKRRMH